MKKIYTLLIAILLLSLSTTYAVDEEELTSEETATEEIIQTETPITERPERNTEEKKTHIVKKEDYEVNTQLWNTTTIDLSNIEKSLSDSLSTKIDFEWNIKWETTQESSIFQKKFESSWQKIINLNIYKTIDEEKQLVSSEDILLFVYKSKTHIIFNWEMWNEEIRRYIQKSTDDWILVERVAEITTNDIEKQNFVELLSKLEWFETSQNNYLTLWGDKEFLSGILSKISKEKSVSDNKELLNLVLISPFNTDVLQSYLKNFVLNKEWIKTIILLPESSISQIRYNPSDIEALETWLSTKEYEYLKIDTQTEINPLLFISQFINTLSNQGFDTNGIWIILIIPFLFTWISLMKHLIWLSPIGSLIPITLTLLWFQIWLLPSGIILGTLILVNLLLSKVTNRYTLLYTPKISFIIIINIAIMMILTNLLYSYDLIKPSVSSIIFIFLFVLIAERLITVVLSKEFWEYKFALLNTILFAVVAYLIFSISYVQTLIFAYPEMIIILIPINFIIWRFTWLRITEYFRFKEVIQNIEE